MDPLTTFGKIGITGYHIIRGKTVHLSAQQWEMVEVMLIKVYGHEQIFHRDDFRLLLEDWAKGRNLVGLQDDECSEQFLAWLISLGWQDWMRIIPKRGGYTWVL